MGVMMLDRRSAMRLGSLAALAVPGGAALAGCGSAAERTAPPLDPAATAPPRAAGHGAKAAAAATDGLAATLYAGLPAKGNLAFSPLSVAIALAMVTDGARGATRHQLRALLGSPTDPDSAFGALMTRVGDQAVTGAKAKDQPVVSLADALFGQQGMTFEKPFVRRLSRDYGAPMHAVDFKADPDGVTASINRWVAGQTHDLIPHLLQPGVITRITRLVLVNALYLKAAWSQAFEVPKPGRFTLPDGTAVTVPMLSGGVGAEAPGKHGSGYTTVRLDYLARDLAMTLIVPDAGRFDEVAGTIAAHGVRRFLGTGSKAFEVTMPAFTVNTHADLTELLIAAGAPLPFSDAADFSAITHGAQLSISHVVHQAKVEVDRHGTIAAAATAVVAVATSARLTTPLVVDRPFLFVIHETTYDAPLFVGRVTDPR